MRQVYVIPIIHSPEDLGRLREVATTIKSQLFSRSLIEASEQAVVEFWGDLKQAIQEWPICWLGLHVFQDALPFIEADQSGLINQIVDDLAAQGSHNHQLLKWIASQGGLLHGSESPDLLRQEYALIQELMELQVAEQASNEQVQRVTDRQQALLALRDDFIAHQIDVKLPDEGSGLIFLGMAHSLEERLEADIKVAYPFGKPAAAESV